MAPRVYEFMRFCMVGGVGFFTDAAVLEFLVRQGLIPPVARAFSIFVAMNVTYGLHGFFTFRHHQGLSAKRWLHFMALNLLGAVINYGVFLAVWSLAPISNAQLARFAGLIAGTAVALGFNYWSNRRFVFRKVENS